MTLFDIDNSIRNLIETMFTAVDEETGELLDFDPEQLETLKEQRESKLEAIACFIKETDAEAAALKSEMDKLAKRKKVAENKATRLRRILAESLIANNEDKFKTAKCAVSFRTSKQVIIDDLDGLNDEFVNVETTRKPDKKLIKEAIEKGADVPAAHIETVKNIQIK